MADSERQLRILLAIDETPLYQPTFVDHLLSRTKDLIVGAALILWVPPKGDPEAYLKRNLHRLRPGEFIKLGSVKLGTDASRVIRRFHTNGRAHSVREALERHGIPYFEVRNSINKPENLAKIRETSPDVILSSQPHILKREILSIPKICCLNRHGSLLPAHAGLWPMFHAIRCGEKEVGVTVHTMDEGIDGGVPLVQHRFPRSEADSMSDLYARSFEHSVDAVLEALDKVRANDFSPCATSGEPSYDSFPTPEQWREFRARGGRII